MKNNLFRLLLLVGFFNVLLFSIAVPIWHGPDEQAHFGQVANFAEYGKSIGGLKNLNREIYESEVLLGTLRDERGNNKFTFNPSYRIEYSDNTIGVHEASISSFSREFRKDLVLNEATVYPPLFYAVSSVFYHFGDQLSLFDRVYLSRVFGWILFLLNLVIGYYFAKEVFMKKLYQYTLLLLFSFHPMLNFVYATVNSDNLFNLYFSGCLLLGVYILKKGLQLKFLFPMIVLFILGIFIKPQFILILPIWLFSIIVSLTLHYKDKKIKNLSLLTLGAGLFFPIAVVIIQFVFNVKVFKTLDLLTTGLDINIKDFTQMTIYRTYRETVPWYWGVFNWLGVVLPRIVNRTLNYLVVISSIGVLVGLFYAFKQRSKATVIIYSYLIFSAVSYYLGIIIFDLFYSNSTGGISIGMQGRYFFPTIFAHMSLILIGIGALARLVKQDLFEVVIVKLLGLGFILLNMIGLYVIASSYYSFASVSVFFNQISQYKPVLFKFPYLLVFIGIYLFILSQLIYTYVMKVGLDEKNN